MSVVTAGIDVAGKSLVVDVLCDGIRAKRGKPFSVDNTPDGHGQLIEKLRDLAVTRIVCEATGVYHLDLAIALVEAGLPVMVANPRQVKAFIQARLRNSQDDPIDAHELAQFGLRMDFRPWQAPDPSHYALHRIARSLHGYVEQATAAKNRLHAAHAVAQTPKLLLKVIKEEIAFLDRIETRLRTEALKIIDHNAKLKRHFDLLISVPGIGQTSAVQLLGELCVLASDLSAKAWVKLAGLDPTRKQSGTSVLGKAHISRRGNAKLRGALFMPAMSARRHDPGLKHFADRLVQNHKTPLQAIVAVQRKLLHGIHAMFTLDQPWNSSALVPQTQNQA